MKAGNACARVCARLRKTCPAAPSAGSVVNFLSLFDDFLVWMRSKRGVEAPVHVLVHESASLVGQQPQLRDMAFARYQVSEVSRLPLLWGEAELALGGCPVTMYLEKETDERVHVKFAGEMQAFTQMLDQEGVRGALCEARDDGVLQNTYVRILRSFDACDPGKLQWILRDCFHCQAMAVVVEDPTPVPNTPVHEFIQTLRGWSCLHFIER